MPRTGLSASVRPPPRRPPAGQGACTREAAAPSEATGRLPPRESNTLSTSDHPCQEARPFQADDGLSNLSDPDDEEEVIVVEEPARQEGKGPRVLRVLRAPTQHVIDDHTATHIPHEEWCDFCMAGRGRNKPQRRNASRREVGNSDSDGAPSGPEAEEEPRDTHVARVSMDYFYVSSRRAGTGAGAQGMSTK
ncbi:hypothetical protein N9L68_00295 [bacterium]|nr:hypothetical protein [bacterium]